MQMLRELFEKRKSIERMCSVERCGDIEIQSQGSPVRLAVPIFISISDEYRHGSYGFSMDLSRRKFTDGGLLSPTWAELSASLEEQYGYVMRMRLYAAIGRKARTVTTVDECMELVLHGQEPMGGEVIELVRYFTPRQHP